MPGIEQSFPGKETDFILSYLVIRLSLEFFAVPRTLSRRVMYGQVVDMWLMPREKRVPLFSMPDPVLSPTQRGWPLWRQYAHQEHGRRNGFMV